MRDLQELNINEGGRPVARTQPTDAQLREFETTFGVKLPEDYVALLRFANGGHPQLDSYLPEGRREPDFHSVNRFYHLTDDKNDLEGLWRATVEWRAATRKNLVPVANDGGGNQIVLNYEFGEPVVQLLIHDEGFRLVPVAGSIEQFLDELTENPDMI